MIFIWSMLLLCLPAAMFSRVWCGSIQAAQLLSSCPGENSSLSVPAADGVIHTAFLHDGSVPYLDAIKIDCAAIKAMTDAMAGTDKPFVQSSATGVMGTTKSPLLICSGLRCPHQIVSTVKDDLFNLNQSR